IWSERMTRHMIFNWIPKSIQTQQFLKDTAYRPQCTFLPFVKNRGTVTVLEQKPSKKHAEQQTRRATVAVI
ncbi:hypothetical protein BX616_002258, partial [Lobosporangium transversale]